MTKPFTMDELWCACGCVVLMSVARWTWRFKLCMDGSVTTDFWHLFSVGWASRLMTAVNSRFCAS